MASITVATIFGIALLVARPMGWIFKVQLRGGLYTHLDGMRAIAALMVVCSHYVVYAGLITNDPADIGLTDALGAVGVQIFFGITGFLFTRKALDGHIDIAGLLLSRVRRIVPAYLVAMTAALAATFYVLIEAHKPVILQPLELLRAYTYGFIVSAPPSVSGLSIAGQAGQMWTLAWEWSFYLLVPVLGVLVARRSRAISAGAVMLLAIAGQHDGSLPVWTFFLSGIVAALLENRITPGTRTQVALTAVGAVSIGAALALKVPVYGFAHMALAVLGFAALLFGHHAPLSIRPLRILGEVSYSMYLLHLTIASLFFTYIHSDAAYLLYQTPPDRLPFAAACVIGLLVLSFASYAMIERPFMGRRKAESSAVPSASATTG
jgi:peptidoglycan/LPS O-acetylase OafA/YrhL